MWFLLQGCEQGGGNVSRLPALDCGACLAKERQLEPRVSLLCADELQVPLKHEADQSPLLQALLHVAAHDCAEEATLAPGLLYDELTGKVLCRLPRIPAAVFVSASLKRFHLQPEGVGTNGWKTGLGEVQPGIAPACSGLGLFSTQ